jgi:hypothetical protein
MSPRSKIQTTALFISIILVSSCATSRYSEKEYDDIYYAPNEKNANHQKTLFNPKGINDTSRISYKTVSFSIFSGMSFTQFTGDSDEFAELLNNSSSLELEKKLRSFIFPFGLSMSLNATSWLSFKTAIMLAPKGIKYSDKIDLGGEEYQVNLILKLSYIEIPLLAEFSVPIDISNKFYLNGGISPAFKVASKIVSKAWNTNAIPGQDDTETDTEDWNDVNDLDVGYTIGCGIKGQTTYLGLQYRKGLKSVSTAGWDFKNQTFTILIGFFF